MLNMQDLMYQGMEIQNEGFEHAIVDRLWLTPVSADLKLWIQEWIPDIYILLNGTNMFEM